MLSPGSDAPKGDRHKRIIITTNLYHGAHPCQTLF